MENNNYRVIFCGKIVADKNPEDVASNLATMFKLDLSKHEHAAKLAKLLSGKPVVIKQGITEQRALLYQKSMAIAGAISTVELTKPDDGSKEKPFVERRKGQRRKRGDRRNVRRTSSILPDRRKEDRRKPVPEPEDEKENDNDGNVDIGKYPNT